MCLDCSGALLSRVSLFWVFIVRLWLILRKKKAKAYCECSNIDFWESMNQEKKKNDLYAALKLARHGLSQSNLWFCGRRRGRAFIQRYPLLLISSCFRLFPSTGLSDAQIQYHMTVSHVSSHQIDIISLPSISSWLWNSQPKLCALSSGHDTSNHCTGLDWLVGSRNQRRCWSRAQQLSEATRRVRVSHEVEELYIK
jgi:hypothetical protein